jgi:hypothetical protein
MSRTTDRSRRWKNHRNGADGASRPVPVRKSSRMAGSPAAASTAANPRDERRMGPYEMSYDVTHGYTLDRPIFVP